MGGWIFWGLEFGFGFWCCFFWGGEVGNGDFLFSYLIVLIRNKSYIFNDIMKLIRIIFLYWQWKPTVGMDLPSKWLWHGKISHLTDKRVLFCCCHAMCGGSPQISMWLSLLWTGASGLRLQHYRSMDSSCIECKSFVLQKVKFYTTLLLEA